MKVRDAKPEVGIFEIVENIFLKDSEPIRPFSPSGRYFEGLTPHRHKDDIKVHVRNSPYVSEKTKAKFAANPDEYLNWPRGRVDYDTQDKVWTIMTAAKFFNGENVERVTREFHLPPYASGKIELVADDGHYDY